jgi:hypothetical protein
MAANKKSERETKQASQSMSTMVRLTRRQRDAVERIAVEEGRTISNAVRRLVEEGLSARGVSLTV